MSTTDSSETSARAVDSLSDSGSAPKNFEDSTRTRYKSVEEFLDLTSFESINEYVAKHLENEGELEEHENRFIMAMFERHQYMGNSKNFPSTVKPAYGRIVDHDVFVQWCKAYGEFFIPGAEADSPVETHNAKDEDSEHTGDGHSEKVTVSEDSASPADGNHREHFNLNSNFSNSIPPVWERGYNDSWLVRSEPNEMTGQERGPKRVEFFENWLFEEVTRKLLDVEESESELDASGSSTLALKSQNIQSAAAVTELWTQRNLENNDYQTKAGDSTVSDQSAANSLLQKTARILIKLNPFWFQATDISEDFWNTLQKELKLNESEVKASEQRGVDPSFQAQLRTPNSELRKSLHSYLRNMVVEPEYERRRYFILENFDSEEIHRALLGIYQSHLDEWYERIQTGIAPSSEYLILCDALRLFNVEFVRLEPTEAFEKRLDECSLKIAATGRVGSPSLWRWLSTLTEFSAERMNHFCTKQLLLRSMSQYCWGFINYNYSDHDAKADTFSAEPLHIPSKRFRSNLPLQVEVSLNRLGLADKDKARIESDGGLDANTRTTGTPAGDLAQKDGLPQLPNITTSLQVPTTLSALDRGATSSSKRQHSPDSPTSPTNAASSSTDNPVKDGNAKVETSGPSAVPSVSAPEPRYNTRAQAKKRLKEEK